MNSGGHASYKLQMLLLLLLPSECAFDLLRLLWVGV